MGVASETRRVERGELETYTSVYNKLKERFTDGKTFVADGGETYTLEELEDVYTGSYAEEARWVLLGENVWRYDGDSEEAEEAECVFDFGVND